MRLTRTLRLYSAGFPSGFKPAEDGKRGQGISDFEMILYRYLPVLYGRSNTTSHQIMDLVNRTSADIERNASSAFMNISTGARNYKDNPDIAIFVIDNKAIVMTHSSRPELVRSNETNRADVSEKKFIEAIVVGALKNGAGQEDYIYSDPNKTGLYYKTAYYRLTRGSDGREYIVGCIDFKEEGSKSI